MNVPGSLSPTRELGSVDDIDAIFDRVREGNAAAFEVFYDRLSRLVFGIGLRMLNDADAAEDLVQTVFLKIWRAPDAYRGGNLTAWIARVARNQALDMLRHQTRHATEPLSIDPPIHEYVDEFVHAKIDSDRVRIALREIPDEQRTPLEMAFFSGITHEEIAKRSATPLGTVKTRIRTGLKRLRQALGNEVLR